MSSPEGLNDAKLSAFLHAESHEQAGTDPELCEDSACPHYPPCSCWGTLKHVAVSPTYLQPPCYCECHEADWVEP